MWAVFLRNLSNMVAKMTCRRRNLWHIPVSASGARGFQQSSFPHAWTTGKASLLTKSIIMQIWHQGISTGHQNLNGPSPLLRLWYTTWSLPFSVHTTSQWIFLPQKEERSEHFYQGQNRSLPPSLSLKNCRYSHSECSVYAPFSLGSYECFPISFIVQQNWRRSSALAHQQE